MIACADDALKVRESKESDTCRTAKGTIVLAGTVTPTPTPTPSATATAPAVDRAPVPTAPAAATAGAGAPAAISGVSAADADSPTLAGPRRPRPRALGQRLREVRRQDRRDHRRRQPAADAHHHRRHAPLHGERPGHLDRPGITATDPDGGTLSGATVQLTTGYAIGQDVLALPLAQVGITRSFSAATATLTLSGLATAASHESALRAITYANTSDHPSGALRTTAFTVTDGADNATASRTLATTPVDDPPALSSAATDPTFTEGGAAVVVDGQIAATDPDDTQLESGSVAIPSPAAGDVLSLADTAGDGITVTGSGTATLTAYRDALRGAASASAIRR